MAHRPPPRDDDGVQRPRVEALKEDGGIRVVLRGESDFSNVRELDQALREITLDGARLVHLDLTHLEFADVATVRRLAAFSGHARRTGHQFTTSGAHVSVRQVAELLDVRADLGLS